jgi:hypothetical protein
LVLAQIPNNGHHFALLSESNNFKNDGTNKEQKIGDLAKQKF